MMFALLPILLVTQSAWPSSVLLPEDGSKVSLKVGYTFGSHQLEASKFQGEIFVDNDKNEISSGVIYLNVEDIKGKDQELVCHLRESLSLDYSVSDFPDAHVCKDGEIPKEGKNSAKFTTITATLVSPLKFTDTEMKLKWLIHGVEREITSPVSILWDLEKKKLEINSNFILKRSDFNIIVKKFLFINADDKIELNLTLTAGAK